MAIYSRRIYLDVSQRFKQLSAIFYCHCYHAIIAKVIWSSRNVKVKVMYRWLSFQGHTVISNLNYRVWKRSVDMTLRGSETLHIQITLLSSLFPKPIQLSLSHLCLLSFVRHGSEDIVQETMQDIRWSLPGGIITQKMPITVHEYVCLVTIAVKHFILLFFFFF